jgi:hypothetical protein
MSSWKASDSDDKFQFTPQDAHLEQQDSKNIDVLDEKPTQLERVQSSSRKSEIDPFTEPPDGGLNAWLKVLGCFLIYSNIW